MKTITWTLADIIDLEYFIQRDECIKDIDSLKKRDREIYLKEIRPLLQDKPGERSLILLLWVKALRKRFLMENKYTPGSVWRHFDQLSVFILVAFGLVFGSSAVVSILHYGGKNPINVFEFFFIIILAPWSFLIAATALRLIKVTERLGDLSSSLLVKIAFKWPSTLLKTGLEKMTDRERVCDIESALIKVLTKARKYKEILANYTLFKLQIFAVSFGIGCLAGFLIKISFFDLAFGWQTSLNMGPEFLEAVVKWLAMPWSFLFPEGVAYPSLEAIKGSRIILKNGIETLSSKDLAAWWPFLAMSIIFYNIIPRLFLLFFANWRLKHSLLGISPSSPTHLKIISRLVTPLVEKEDGIQKIPLKKETNNNDKVSNSSKVFDTIASQCTRAIIFMPEEMLPIVSQFSIEKFLSSFNIKEFSIYEAEELLIDVENSLNSRIVELVNQSKKGSILVFMQEAWQPPLQEFLSFLNKMVKVFPDLYIIVALCGRVGKNREITMPLAYEVDVWKKKISLLGEHNISVEVLGSD